MSDLDRLSTAFRRVNAIPIVVVFASPTGVHAIPAMLLILFPQNHPRWWFDFNPSCCSGGVCEFRHTPSC